MRLHEVPPGCRAVQCKLCGDYLAAPLDQTREEIIDMMVEHHVLCPAVARARDGRGLP